MPYSDLVQIAGAALVLAAFVVTQNGLGRPGSTYVLILNAAGAGILAYLALISSQWGFLALEGVWSLLAAGNLATKFWRGSHTRRASESVRDHDGHHRRVRN